jgi:hypothetical protein
MGIVKAAFGIFLFAAVIIGVFQIAPPVMANYNFQDDLKTVAMIDGGNMQKTDEDVRTEVMRKVKEHDLPIEPKQVTVQHITTPGLPSVYIAVDYSMTVNLPGYSFDMHFNPNSGNKGF